MLEALSSAEAQPIRVLVVDDDADVRQAAALLLRRHGFHPVEAEGPAAALAAVAAEPAEVVLLDLNFRRGAVSGEEGLACLADLRLAAPAAQVVVVTAHSGVAMAVEAMRRGASDFVTKPWSNKRLVATLEAAAERARSARASASQLAEGPVYLGESAAARRVRELIRRAAPLAASVLVHGPAGVGKSLIAQALHAGSARAAPLRVFDLTVEEIGAVLQALADDEAIALDSPEALAPAAQAALAARLAAGGPRVIAGSRATPTELRAALRPELFYALAAIEVEAPPLQARGDDAALLADHWLALAARRHRAPLRALSPAARQALPAHAWPDDARGLRHALERALLLGEGPIAPEELLPVVADALPAGASDLNLQRSERALVEAALARWGFNVSGAARELGLTRGALYRRMAKHGL